MPSLENQPEPGGEAAEDVGCCSHAECEDSVSSSRCTRHCRLVFITTELLRYPPDRRVRGCLQALYFNKLVKPCSVRQYHDPAKSGLYVYDVRIEIPDGMEFYGIDWYRVEDLCTPEGQARPMLFRETCCREKARLVEESILSLLDWDSSSGYRGTMLVKASLGKLARSILDVLGPSCDCL